MIKYQNSIKMERFQEKRLKSKFRPIIGFQEHTLALRIRRNLNKNGLQNLEHGKPSIMGKRPNCIGF